MCIRWEYNFSFCYSKPNLSALDITTYPIFIMIEKKYISFYNKFPLQVIEFRLNASSDVLKDKPDLATCKKC